MIIQYQIYLFRNPGLWAPRLVILMNNWLNDLLSKSPAPGSQGWWQLCHTITTLLGQIAVFDAQEEVLIFPLLVPAGSWFSLTKTIRYDIKAACGFDAAIVVCLFSTPPSESDKQNFCNNFIPDIVEFKKTPRPQKYWTVLLKYFRPTWSI